MYDLKQHLQWCLPTQFVCGANHQKSPLMWTAYLWNCMSDDQRDLKSHTSEIWLFEVIFVVIKLMRNIIFNKTESFVGRNTNDHACQIFFPKSNCETMYRWFFLLEIIVVKIMNNLNVCSAHSYSYPRSQFKGSPFCTYVETLAWPHQCSPLNLY